MDFKIPLFDLNFDEKEEEAVLDTLRSRWISTGPKTEKLEDKFCGMLGSTHALGVANCTAALHLGMLLLGIKEGDEVITPALTFVATVNAIRYVGATPVFCDIKGVNDLTINTDLLESLITKKTRAIIVMHYGGFPNDMDKVISVAEKHGLKVLEDACHGPLSEYHGKKLGTIGDIGCFSFFSNKNISTGEGGILVTNNRDYFERGKLLRSHGMTTMSYERSKGHSTAYDVVELGYNYRIDDIHSAIALVQIEKLKEDIEKRQIIRRKYIDNLKGIKKVVIPFDDNKEYVSNYIFPIVLRDSTVEFRDLVRNRLQIAGIQTSVHYPAVNRFSIYKQFDRGGLHNTEYVADNEITLPMYAKLTDESIKYITDTIRSTL
jgi:dTDP-4-amino-4,6-dideoxygalactose transaminase